MQKRNSLTFLYIATPFLLAFHVVVVVVFGKALRIFKDERCKNNHHYDDGDDIVL